VLFSTKRSATVMITTIMHTLTITSGTAQQTPPNGTWKRRVTERQHHTSDFQYARCTERIVANLRPATPPGRLGAICARMFRVPLVACSFFAVGPGMVNAQSHEQTDGVSGLETFVVRPGNVLRITVWPDGALGGEFAVEESGFVYLPVLGPVYAGGISLDALRRQLREAYREVIHEPVVTVTPLFRVSVLGAVNRPGLYRVDPSQSLFDVLSLAGGMRQDAKEDELRLIRDGQVLEINAERALETGEALLALALRTGDRIVVPKKQTLLTAQNVFYVLQAAVVAISILQLINR